MALGTAFLNRLSRQARHWVKHPEIQSAALYAALGTGLKAVGSGFRSFVDFKDSPLSVKTSSLLREGTLLGIVGAASFGAQIALNQLFKLGKTSLKQKTILRTLMLIPAYVGAETYSRHVGKINFTQMFKPSKQVNPFAFTTDSFVSSSQSQAHQPLAQATVNTFSKQSQGYYGKVNPSFAQTPFYHVSFAASTSSRVSL